MKKSYHIKWAAFIILVFGIFVSSCSKDEFVPTDENVGKLKGDVARIVLPGDPANCDLIAGQEVYAGQVLYANDENNLYVQYVTEGEWLLSEVHLYVGLYGELPIGKKGNPKIGHFPYAEEYLETNTYTFTIPLDEIAGDCFTIAAHAVVYKEVEVYEMDELTRIREEETAWSKCDFEPEILTLKSFLKKPDGSTFWAARQGVPITDNTDIWCSIIGINDIPEDYSIINLISNFYTNPGEIHVTKLDNSIEIEVIAGNGLELYETYLYVGTQNDLDSYLYFEGGCPAYLTFPYKVIGEYSAVHTFTIPITSSTSFEGKAWGWLSNYCLQ